MIPTTSYEVQMIPIGQIAESPFNPRKTFLDMEDLVADVKKRGILQPVLVRPIASNAKGYELVFGARRFRAAKGAKLDTVPAMVRELADDEALELMIVENCKRSDIHPLEEADGYRQLHERHGHDVEDIAAKVGKSKAYVYGRMKLCALEASARKAFVEGQLSPSVALLVARIPKSLQAKATHELTHEHSWNGKGAALEEPLSFRDAAERVQRDYMLRLDEAPFPRGDAALLPAAGPCTLCPKRTGNQRELFAEVRSADVCSDPPCFKQKVEAFWKRTQETAEASGYKVLSESEAKKVLPKNHHGSTAYQSGYVLLEQSVSGADYRSKAYGKHYSELLKAPLKKGELTLVLARDSEGKIHKLLSEKEASAALRKLGISKQGPSSGTASKSSSKSSSPKQSKEDFERLEKTARAAVSAIVERVEKKDDISVWRALAGIVWENCQYASDEILKRRQIPERALVARIAKAKAPELRGLFVEFSLAPMLEDLYGTELPDYLTAAAKALGVDLKKIEKEIAATEAIKSAEASFQKPAKKTARKK